MGTPIINLELLTWHTFKLLVKVGLFVCFFCLQMRKTFYGSRNNEFTGMFAFLIIIEFDWSRACISTGCHQAILIYFMNSAKTINLCKSHFFLLAFFQLLNLFHQALPECSLLLYFHHQHLHLIWDLFLVDINSSQNVLDQSSSRCYVMPST